MTAQSFVKHRLLDSDAEARLPLPRGRDCVGIVSLEAHILTHECAIAYFGLKLQRCAVAGHPDVIRPRREVEQRRRFPGLHFIVDLNAGARRAGRNTERASSLLQLKKNVRALRNMEYSRVGSITRELCVEGMTASCQR